MFTHKPLLKGRRDGWEFYQGPFPHQFPDGRVITLVGAYSGQETFLDNAALSTDGCKTWPHKRDIATETGRNQISNHGVTQLDDGRILIAFSHYHATEPKPSDVETVLFDEAWVRTGSGR